MANAVASAEASVQARLDAEGAATSAEIPGLTCCASACTDAGERPMVPGLNLDDIGLHVGLHVCTFLQLKDLGRLACISRDFDGLLAPVLLLLQSKDWTGIESLSAVRWVAEEVARNSVQALSAKHRARVEAAWPLPRFHAYSTTPVWLRRLHEFQAGGLAAWLSPTPPYEFSAGGNGYTGDETPWIKWKRKLRESCREFSIVARSECVTVGDDAGVDDRWMGTYDYVTSAAVMRDGGRYYAAFTPLDSGEFGDMLFGVTRPNRPPDGRRCHHWAQLRAGIWPEQLRVPWVEDGSCFFRTGDFVRHPSSGWNPVGCRLRFDGTETIGLLLDLDAGTMTADLNGHFLGVMATGLTGEYTWAVSLDQGYDTGVVRVEVGPPHFRPTHGTSCAPKWLLQWCEENWRQLERPESATQLGFFLLPDVETEDYDPLDVKETAQDRWERKSQYEKKHKRNIKTKRAWKGEKKLRVSVRKGRLGINLE